MGDGSGGVDAAAIACDAHLVVAGAGKTGHDCIPRTSFDPNRRAGFMKAPIMAMNQIGQRSLIGTPVSDTGQFVYP